MGGVGKEHGERPYLPPAQLRNGNAQQRGMWGAGRATAPMPISGGLDGPGTHGEPAAWQARLTGSLVPSQKDFTVREELQQQDVERWLGFITFLCEVFGTMRSSTGEPFRVLVCPIYTCLREVRDAHSTCHASECGGRSSTVAPGGSHGIMGLNPVTIECLLSQRICLLPNITEK